jgi:hypothetical protein
MGDTMIKIKIDNSVLYTLVEKMAALDMVEERKNMMRIAATTVLSRMTERIHEDGRNESGSDIGVYSKRPIYVSLANNPGKSVGRPIGKTGRSRFRTGAKAGQDHLSRYFPGGYDEYKKAIGRNIGKVNLNLSGQLRQQTTVIDSGGIGIGWADEEKTERAEALQKKYRAKIWYPNDKESEAAVEAVTAYIYEKLNQ